MPSISKASQTEYNMKIETVKKTFNKNRRWTILLVSALATFILLWIANWNPLTATKIVGVDNYNIRDLYYKVQFNQKGKSSIGDSIVIYQPFTADVPDVRLQIAKELGFLCQFHPKAIIFDYVFEEEHEFTKTSDSLLISAIDNCIVSGIKFYAPYTNDDKVRIN